MGRSLHVRPLVRLRKLIRKPICEEEDAAAAAADQEATVQVAVTAAASSGGGTVAACPGRLGRGRAAQRAPGRTAPRLPSPDSDRQLARSGPAERSAEQSCRTGVQPVRRRSGMGGTRPRQGVPAGGKSKGMWTRNQCTLIPAGTSCGASSTTAAYGARGCSAKRKATSDGGGAGEVQCPERKRDRELHAARAGRGIPPAAETEPARNSLIARRAMRCSGARQSRVGWGSGRVPGGGVGRDGSRNREGRERSRRTTRRRQGYLPRRNRSGNTRRHTGILRRWESTRVHLVADRVSFGTTTAAATSVLNGFGSS